MLKKWTLRRNSRPLRGEIENNVAVGLIAVEKRALGTVAQAPRRDSLFRRRGNRLAGGQGRLRKLRLWRGSHGTRRLGLGTAAYRNRRGRVNADAEFVANFRQPVADDLRQVEAALDRVLLWNLTRRNAVGRRKLRLRRDGWLRLCVCPALSASAVAAARIKRIMRLHASILFWQGDYAKANRR